MDNTPQLTRLREKLDTYEEYAKEIRQFKGCLDNLKKQIRSYGDKFQRERLLKCDDVKDSFLNILEVLEKAKVDCDDIEKVIDIRVRSEFLERGRVSLLCGAPLEQWLTCSDPPLRVLAVEAQERIDNPSLVPVECDDSTLMF